MKCKIIPLVFVFLSFALIISCKKKEKELTNITSSQPAYEPNKIDAVLWHQKHYQLINDILQPFNGFTTLVIFDSLRNKDNVNLSYGVDAGNVIVNGFTLKKEKYTVSSNVSYYYTDTLNSIFDKPCNWSIAGNGSVPAINFSDYSNYPSYLGYNNLPDTLMAFQSNAILINSYYGADRIVVQLRGTFGSISRTIYPPEKNIELSTANMAQVNTSGGNNYVELRIYFSKSEFKNIDGKIFQIENAIDVWKDNVYVKE